MSEVFEKKFSKLEKLKYALWENPDFALSIQFDDKYNFPLRFFAYSNPQSLDGLFDSLHNALVTAKKTIRYRDCWHHDSVMRILDPGFVPKSISKTLACLVRQYKIPEGHIRLVNEKTKYELFPSEQIYVSRYGMYLAMKEHWRRTDSFKNDMAPDLPPFRAWCEEEIEPVRQANAILQNRLKADFEKEVKTIFARYYFAFPDGGVEKVTKAFWHFVRGSMLKEKFEPAKKKLIRIIESYMDPKIKSDNTKRWGMIGIFLDNCVFNPLFANIETDGHGIKNIVSFQSKYDSALYNDFGYRKRRKILTNGKEQIYWCKQEPECPDKIISVPKAPGSLISPAHMFFLAKHMGLLADLVDDKEKTAEFKEWLHEKIGSGKENKYSLNATESDKIKNSVIPGSVGFREIQLLTMEYFISLRIAWDRMAAVRPEISSSPMFLDESYSKCYDFIKTTEFGKGSKKKSKWTGEIRKEKLGVLDEAIAEILFDRNEEESICYYTIRDMKANLQPLYKKLQAAPDNEQIKKEIFEHEEELRIASEDLYGSALQVFTGIPQKLTPNGLIQRPIYERRR